MAGSAPSYENVRWGGKSGLRVPTEAGPAGLRVNKMVTVSGAGSSAVTLSAEQTAASLLVITNMGSISSVVSLPAAFPGHLFAVKNSTGSGSAVTFKVTGQTGVAIADGSHAILVCNATDLERWTLNA